VCPSARWAAAITAGDDHRVPVHDHQLRATSFGSQAEDYARYRPAPPADAAAWAVGSHRDLVVDVAAGTGNLTALLLPLAERVVALDLDRRMLRVLGQRVSGAVRAAARGEALPLRGQTADAVLISSAWHWLDHDRAWPELARVLRSGGALAVLWGGPDRTVPWVAEVLGHRRAPGGPGSGWWGRQREVALPADAPFTGVEDRVFSGEIDFAVADLPRLAASYSRLITLPAGERARALAGVAAAAARRPELEGRTTITLPLRCRVWRAVRI
jgi:SAM-dependent methyltransferase